MCALKERRVPVVESVPAFGLDRSPVVGSLSTERFATAGEWAITNDRMGKSDGQTSAVPVSFTSNKKT